MRIQKVTRDSRFLFRQHSTDMWSQMNLYAVPRICSALYFSAAETWLVPGKKTLLCPPLWLTNIINRSWHPLLVALDVTENSSHQLYKKHANSNGVSIQDKHIFPWLLLYGIMSNVIARKYYMSKDFALDLEIFSIWPFLMLIVYKNQGHNISWWHKSGHYCVNRPG